MRHPTPLIAQNPPMPCSEASVLKMWVGWRKEIRFKLIPA
jgi:hypothetical protein